MRVARGRSGNWGTTRGPGGVAGGGQGGVRGRLWERATTNGASVGVMARRPSKARGTLVNGALISIVTKTVTGVTCLMITRVSGRERNLCITSSPPGFKSLKNSFFFRCKRGGRGGDVRGRGGLGGKGSDEERGGARAVSARKFQHVPLNVF